MTTNMLKNRGVPYTKCAKCDYVCIKPNTVQCGHQMCILCAFEGAMERGSCRVCGEKIVVTNFNYDRAQNDANEAAFMMPFNVMELMKHKASMLWNFKNVRKLLQACHYEGVISAPQLKFCMDDFEVGLSVEQDHTTLMARVSGFNPALSPFTPATYCAQDSTLSIASHATTDYHRLIYCFGCLLAIHEVKEPKNIKLLPSPIAGWDHMISLKTHMLILRKVSANDPRVDATSSITTTHGRTSACIRPEEMTTTFPVSITRHLLSYSNCFSVSISIETILSTKWLCAKVHGPEMHRFHKIEKVIKKIEAEHVKWEQ